MILVTCIERFRNNNDQIVGYRLKDNTGATKDVTTYQLQQAIASKQVVVSNLKLTQNGRIIRCRKNKDIINIGSISGKEAIDRLIHSDTGTPVMIKLTNDGEYKQTVFVGIRDVQYRESFVFFDGSALTGQFALGSKFIENNKDTIRFKFDENSPEELAHLLSLIHNNK